MGDCRTWDAETEDADRPIEDTDCPGAAGDDGAEGAVCNLQRIYQGLLSAMSLREEKVPPGRAGAARGAAVMGSLGALSQAIDEYDLLHFRRPPGEKLADFGDWLQSEAPLFFEEPGETSEKGASTLAEADAVTVCTIHKAKGREWPAVFIPGLAEGRFPHSGQSYGRTRWHILPREAVRDAARYETTAAEEARLMYVGVTRAKKFVTCTFAPDPSLTRPQQASSFLRTFASCPGVRTVRAGQAGLPVAGTPTQRQKLPPRARIRERALVLTFSQLAAYLRCPYLFALRALYGWAAPPSEAEGFGKGGHDALGEVHAGAIGGQMPEGDPEELARTLTERHLLLPYAGEEAYQALAQAAARELAIYLTGQRAQIRGVTAAEAPFEIVLEGGVTIVGRNDVLWSQDGEVTLREIKSRREVQSAELTRTQLYIEDLGHHASKGRHVDYLEAYNLAGGEGEEAGVQFRERFDPCQSERTQAHLLSSAAAIHRRDLPRLPVYCATCQRCDHPGICRDAQE